MRAAARRRWRGSDGECGDGWAIPRLLGEVRARQQAVARELRLGFWNWSMAMGGRCASSQWRLAERMRGDHVHFTRDGGDRIGALLDADINRAVEGAADRRSRRSRRP